MRKTFILILLSLFSFISYAQNKEVTNEKYGPKKGTFAIGIDATPLLNYVGNIFNKDVNNNAKSIFSNNKIYIKSFVADRGAIRLGLGADISSKSILFEESSVINNDSRFSLDFGYEFRKNNGRLHLLYGPLLSFNYLSSSSKDVNPIGLPKNLLSLKTIDDHCSYAISWFTGVEYFFHPSISVGGEASLMAGYAYNSGTKFEKEKRLADGSSDIERQREYPKQREFSFLKNFSGSLYIMFHF